MIDFVYNRRFFKIREVLFAPYGDCKKTKSDIIFLHNTEKAQVSCDRPFLVKKQFTILTDLTDSEESLLKLIKKGCRYDIRRAENEGAEIDIYDKNNPLPDKVLQEFAHTYNQMFKIKGMKLRLNIELIKQAIPQGFCTICVAKNKLESEDLYVYHAYLNDESNALLLYSTSNIWKMESKDAVNFIGRMNKFLHWSAILYFKRKGFLNYEWGGISDPENPNGIDKFKMEFGGKVESYDNYVISNSFFGDIYLRLLKRRVK